ncbi:unnamed protein product, partial [Discosporangium mesarthrocarpum]
MIHLDAEQAFVQADKCRGVCLSSPWVSRAWNQHITSTLKFFGFNQSHAGPCLLLFCDGNEATLLVATLVDDMIAVGSRENCDALCDALTTVFPTKNLGLRWCTGCAFERDRKQGTVQISPTTYADQLCERFDVFSLSPLPSAPHNKILPRQENEATRSERYREQIGTLLGVVNMARSDMSNVVRALEHYSHEPSEVHWNGALNILHYLRGSYTLGITYRKGMGLELYAFANLSYAGYFHNRRSVSG